MSALVFISGADDIAGHIARARGDRMLDLALVVADGAGARTIEGIRVIDVGAIHRGQLSAALDRSVVGRTLVRVSPRDGGAVLRRRIHRSAEAMRAIDAADVVVACQRDALLTVWSAARRRPEAMLGLYGIAAGLAELRRR